ncbi:MAG: aldo/keto reductase [Cyanobacteria bacterium P01_A01_bin.116]
MRYRRFGKTERDLSLFSLGTMRFASAEAAEAVITTAIAQGINHIETAPAYGPSEAYIGQALTRLFSQKQCRREHIMLTSKLAPALKAEQVEPAIQASLKRLGVTYLDGLAIHGINTFEHLAWAQAHMLAPLAKARAKGLIRHIGFSTHGPLTVIQAAIATQFSDGLADGLAGGSAGDSVNGSADDSANRPNNPQTFDFINLHYNFFFQRNQAAIAQAHQQDMGIFIISPADKAGMLYTPPHKLKELCAPFAPLLLNYRWLLSDPRITTLSLGPAVPSELAWPLQVADDDGPLSPQEQQIIQQLEQVQKSELGCDRCAQCHQCLPCPESINIPEVLRLRNLAVAYDMEAFGKYRYGMFENAGHWFPGQKGNRCTDCGDCLPHCPESLNIPALLQDTHQRLKGQNRRRLWQE